MQSFLIISGTNRTHSYSRRISNWYKTMLTEMGETAEIIDLTQLPDNFLNAALYENAGKNLDFSPFRKKVNEAPKLIFIVAEYNGSFPGALKAFIDGMEYPKAFKNKKAALVGLSSGVQGGGLALSHLTDILNYCGTHVLAQKPKLAQIEKNFSDGQITNSLYEQLLREQAASFIAF